MYPVVLKQVMKTYHLDAVDVPALVDINLQLRANCFTVISGPSGSGKTTLLNLIGCIDRADSGEVIVADQAVHQMSDDALSDFRARHLGFIFQNFNLLPVLNTYENVEYPLILAKVAAGERKKRVLDLLDAVGLADRAQNLPGQLSGGCVSVWRLPVHWQLNPDWYWPMNQLPISTARPVLPSSA